MADDTHANETGRTKDAQWLAGYAAAKAQAAALARLYHNELIRMATDDAMLDPARNGDVSPEDAAQSAELEVTMWQKAAAAHTAEDIAGTIDSMQPSMGNGEIAAQGN